ncbi:hypothetical protein DY245_31765 [Streptomyces inhibens]|uniref:Resolvase/invertase-type recombinase catalytic domain-containing protein n=1 Tax=Streptomyces inhibens TaxID=2293571 RepID=A0A371PWI0_STRIH|nr:hypothetical protein DY245_31765 [Streptomyces inhibens]
MTRAGPAAAPAPLRRHHHGHQLDQLFHSVQNHIIVGTDLRDRGIRLHTVEQGIDSNTLDGRDFFAMMSVFADMHRELVLAPTNDGPAAARARGRTGGRPHDSPRNRSNKRNSSTTPAPRFRRSPHFQKGLDTFSDDFNLADRGADPRVQVPRWVGATHRSDQQPRRARRLLRGGGIRDKARALVPTDPGRARSPFLKCRRRWPN